MCFFVYFVNKDIILRCIIICDILSKRYYSFWKYLILLFIIRWVIDYESFSSCWGCFKFLLVKLLYILNWCIYVDFEIFFMFLLILCILGIYVMIYCKRWLYFVEVLFVCILCNDWF